MHKNCEVCKIATNVYYLASNNIKPPGHCNRSGGEILCKPVCYSSLEACGDLLVLLL